MLTPSEKNKFWLADIIRRNRSITHFFVVCLPVVCLLSVTFPRQNTQLQTAATYRIKSKILFDFDQITLVLIILPGRRR